MFHDCIQKIKVAHFYGPWCSMLVLFTSCKYVFGCKLQHTGMLLVKSQFGHGISAMVESVCRVSKEYLGL